MSLKMYKFFLQGSKEPFLAAHKCKYYSLKGSFTEKPDFFGGTAGKANFCVPDFNQLQKKCPNSVITLQIVVTFLDAKPPNFTAI